MKTICLAAFLCCGLLAAAQKLPYKVIAYYTGKGSDVQQWPVEKLTHIIYSFLAIRGDTLCFTDTAQEHSLQQLVALKQQYPRLKIMISIGGWGGCGPCSKLFALAEHRNNFAKSTRALFDQYQIDGIDLDWEYPAIAGFPGHTYSPEDRNNFTALVKVLRQHLGNKYLITFAAGGFTSFLEKSIDWDNVIPMVDFVNLMTYDLVGGYSKVTGHHTPTYDYMPGQGSANKCVTWLLQHNIPGKKLVVGAATYARVWQNVPNVNNGLYQPGQFKQGVDMESFKQYFSNTSGFTCYWDKKAKAPYQYNAAKQLFATFDNQRSIKAKTTFIRRKKLGGIMFWELRSDAKIDGLTSAMANGLK